MKKVSKIVKHPRENIQNALTFSRDHSSALQRIGRMLVPFARAAIYGITAGVKLLRTASINHA